MSAATKPARRRRAARVTYRHPVDKLLYEKPPLGWATTREILEHVQALEQRILELEEGILAEIRGSAGKPTDPPSGP